MAVCILWSSLDDSQLFQEEVRELLWITEDISELYKENSAMLEKIKKLTLELEEVISYEDTEDELEDNADFPDEKAMWLVKEEMLQTTLAQQLEHLCQDVFTLHQPQHGNLNCKYLYFKNKVGGKGAALDVAVHLCTVVVCTVPLRTP